MAATSYGTSPGREPRDTQLLRLIAAGYHSSIHTAHSPHNMEQNMERTAYRRIVHGSKQTNNKPMNPWQYPICETSPPVVARFKEDGPARIAAFYTRERKMMLGDERMKYYSPVLSGD